MKNPTSVAIYDTLRQNILSGGYGPQQFLVEREIAEQFSVSRAPVRDALTRLAQEGYLTSYPRKGHLVNLVSSEYLIEIQQIRFQLESLALALVIDKASDRQLDEFAEDYRSCQGQNASTNPYHTANTIFHENLASLSGNTALQKSIHQYLGECSLAVFQHPEIVHDQDNYHEDIIQALKHRDLENAQKYLLRDLQLNAEHQRTALLPI